MWWHTRRNFRRNGRVHLNRRGASVQLTTGSRVVRISGSNAGYTMSRGSVKGTGYQIHSTVSPFTFPPVRHYVPLHFNCSLLPVMRTPRLPVVDWTDAPADLNGLVRFAQTRNLVSARAPSHFKWPLAIYMLIPWETGTKMCIMHRT